MVQTELERFQNSIQRCLMGCQDEIKDKVAPDAPDNVIAGYRKDFEKCAIQCTDTNIERLPRITQKIKEAFASGRY